MARMSISVDEKQLQQLFSNEWHPSKLMMSEAIQMEWIPVEEGYPEDEGYVLVSFGGSPTMTIGYYSDGSWYSEGDDFFVFPVKAWRLLPQDYEAHDDNV